MHLYCLGFSEGQGRRPLRLARLCGAAEGIMWTLDQVLDVGFIVPNADLASTLKEYTRMTGETPDEQAFAAAWAEGRAMTLEQAIEYALSEAK